MKPNKPSSFLQNLKWPFKSHSGKESPEGEDLEKLAAQEQKQFSLETLIAATRDFHSDNKLGEGGFGPVYKGKLVDGRDIAVKRLSHSSNQGKKEFANEAKLLAKVQHRNVVNLLGYCAHEPEKLLVYEYVANESLDKLLFHAGRREELDWKRRYDVIAGVARGLLYLHEDSHSVIIHRDIKASNILLDDKWVPKIADFGMARLYPEDATHINTRVAGTNGYMAPEYLMHGQLSVKADVYSYGVVVLELISGQKNSTFNRDPDCQNLLDWVWKHYKKGRSLDIMHPMLASTAVPEQVTMCIQIGLLCTQGDPKLRPSMRRVVVMLSKRPGTTLEEPSRPGYPGSRYRRSHRPHATSSSAADGSSGGGGSSEDFSNTFSSTSSIRTATTSTPTREPSRLDNPGSRHRRTHRPHAASSSAAGSSNGVGSSRDFSSDTFRTTSTTKTDTTSPTSPKLHSYGKRPMQQE
ncbi:putative receptor-like protein kinase At4g00960 [Telopea speciosissima]|uniref:putative receptor-like protein kinase At4g00960 n=1 Tax=Telopea speciosissima TaxID=54955 RepID=UPI001CC476EF|nr:putative receptor-like protein kinase At4g00960 [Telopea speciosissima]